MNSAAFLELLHKVITHSYLFFFIATVVEGTLVTIAAGVASALHYFNIWAIIGIAIMGDLVADTIFYGIGYYGGRALADRHGHRFGLTPVRIEKVTKLLHKNILKTMTIVKLSPVIPVPGLIIIGITRAPLRKFVESSFIVTVPKTILFAFLGYFTGRAYEQLSGNVGKIEYIIFGIVPAIALFYFLYQKVTQKISKSAGVE